MMKARSESKRAYLVRDKLFVNNREVHPEVARTGEKGVNVRL